jgi:hypothetical protein
LIPGENNKPASLMISFIDLTKQRHAEIIAREKEIQYQSMYCSVKDAIILELTPKI